MRAQQVPAALAELLPLDDGPPPASFLRGEQNALHAAAALPPEPTRVELTHHLGDC